MPRSAAFRILWAAPLVAGLSLTVPATPAFAQDTKCARPRAPEVPEGDEATDVQMIGTNQRMKLYQVAVQTFLECIATARAEIGTVARDMKLRRLDKQRDEVTAELKATAENYNKQVRVYRARKGPVDPDPTSEPPAEGSEPGTAEPRSPEPGQEGGGAPRATPGS